MEKPWVAVIIGSKGDKEKIESSKLREVFSFCGVKFEESVFSAHRHREKLERYCKKAMATRVTLFIAGAGKAAHLPGAVATITDYKKPVIGVAISSSAQKDARDAALSIYRMPAGCPVSLIGIDRDGFTNAAMQACQIIGVSDNVIGRHIKKKLAQFREANTDSPEEKYYSS